MFFDAFLTTTTRMFVIRHLRTLYTLSTMLYLYKCGKQTVLLYHKLDFFSDYCQPLARRNKLYQVKEVWTTTQKLYSTTIEIQPYKRIGFILSCVSCYQQLKACDRHINARLSNDGSLSER